MLDHPRGTLWMEACVRLPQLRSAISGGVTTLAFLLAEIGHSAISSGESCIQSVGSRIVDLGAGWGLGVVATAWPSGPTQPIGRQYHHPRWRKFACHFDQAAAIQKRHQNQSGHRQPPEAAGCPPPAARGAASRFGTGRGNTIRPAGCRTCRWVGQLLERHPCQLTPRMEQDGEGNKDRHRVL